METKESLLKKLPRDKIEKYKQDAVFLNDCALFQDILIEIENKGKAVIWDKSDSPSAILNGKVMLYTVDLIKQIVGQFK